jgi:hypothetical protein
MVKRKIPSPSRDSNPPITQPVTQRYTAELPRLPEVSVTKYIEKQNSLSPAHFL